MKEIKRTKQGYIYLFSDDTRCKLGFTTDIRKRYKSITRYDGDLNIDFVLEGSLATEQAIHSTFKHRALEGSEWYPKDMLGTFYHLLRKLRLQSK